MDNFVNILIYIGIGIVASAIIFLINIVFFGSIKQTYISGSETFTENEPCNLRAALFGAIETLITGTMAAIKLFPEYSFFKAFGLSAIFLIVWITVVTILCRKLLTPEESDRDLRHLMATVFYSISSGVFLTIFLALCNLF